MLTVLSSTVIFVVFTMLLAFSILLSRRVLVPDTSIEITINAGQSIDAHYGDKLLRALADNAIHIPSACAGAGTCGLCRVHIVNGITPATPIEKALLSRSDIVSGTRLACQQNLRKSMAIDIPDEFLAIRSWHAEVISNRALSPLIREIRLKPEDIPFEFTPGDFMQIVAPPGTVHLADINPGEIHLTAWQSMNVSHLGVQWTHPVTRAYSLANRPVDTDTVTLMIRLALPPAESHGSVPPGIVSSWLATRRAGDRVEISGPHRGFHIVNEERELVFVGGGVGMAPLRAMIHQQIARQHALPMTFFYGARSQLDLLYRQEFDALSDANNGFTWIDALSEPEADWEGERGFIHTVFHKRFLAAHPAAESCDYYLCGPPLMITAVVDELHSAGILDNHIQKDEFG